ncbi:hypothetical protein Tco_1520920, partial [Tanacetum coccineum]
MVDPEFDEEEMDDDDGWEEDDEWLMAPVTPPRATVTISSTYEVRGPSTTTLVGHPLAIMAPGVATQPQVIDDLCIYMDNLEYRHRAMTRRMEATKVAKMESREGTMMSYMLWMEERLTVLEKSLLGPSPGAQIMPPKAMSEARMREVIREQVAASMAEFMANMNRGADGDAAAGGGAGGGEASGAGAGGVGAGGAGAGGARPAAPKITGCTYITFMKCDPQPFKGNEGAVGLCQWFEKLESVIASMGINAANGTPWTEVKVEQYIRGLSKNIHGDVTSSRPAGIDEAVRMAYQLIGQIIQDKTDEVSEDEKRKGEGDRGGHGDNRRNYNRQ